MVFQSGLANFDILLLGANREGFVFKEWAFNIIFICRTVTSNVENLRCTVHIPTDTFGIQNVEIIGNWHPSARGNIEPPRMNFLTHIGMSL